jgi:hypothetical protein
MLLAVHRLAERHVICHRWDRKAVTNSAYKGCKVAGKMSLTVDVTELKPIGSDLESQFVCLEITSSELLPFLLAMCLVFSQHQTEFDEPERYTQ